MLRIRYGFTEIGAARIVAPGSTFATPKKQNDFDLHYTPRVFSAFQYPYPAFSFLSTN